MDGWIELDGWIALDDRVETQYLGGIDFMLLSGSSKTLGQASGVTEM